jgi:hypothetical protein
VIFSRGRGNKRGRRGADDGANSADQFDEYHELAELEDDGEAAGGGAHRAGPYDVADAPADDIERLDLGALRIPAIAGVEIQLQAGDDGEIQQVVCVYGESRLQLGVFAAPRTEGIWDELRASLRTTLAQAGGMPQDLTGDHGPELRARLREGGTTYDVRHLGVDGPRWFVYGVYFGAAATRPEQAGPLAEVLRGLIVDRGVEARPVREALPLRLPPEAAAQLAQARSNGTEPTGSPQTDAPASPGGAVRRGGAARPATRGTASGRRS